MDPQLQQRMLIYAGLIPGALSLVVLLTGWYLYALRAARIDHDRGDTPARRGDGPCWLLPLVLAAGVLGANHAINPALKLWPDDNTYRYPHAIALIALLGLAEGLLRIPVLLALLLRALVYAAAFWVLGEGYADTVFAGAAPFVSYLAFAAIAAALVATAADHAARRRVQSAAPGQDAAPRHGWADAATWLIIIAGAMPTLFMNHFGLGAQLPVGIVAVMTPTLIVALLFRDLRLARGGVTVLVGFMLAMLIGAIVHAGAVSLPSVLLLAAAPLVLLIPLTTPSGLKLLLARAAVLIVILAGAYATLHYAQHSAQPGEDDASGMWDS